MTGLLATNELATMGLMSKPVRNTVFTIMAVVLSSVGLSWNRAVVHERQPLAEAPAVSASDVSIKERLDVNEKQDFPLTLSLERTAVKIGQYQTYNIKTIPNAELKLTTVYPNGSVNNPDTFDAVANEVGSYQYSFKMTDFQYLGPYQVHVVATSSGQQASASDHFVLQTWIAPSPSEAPELEYRYPLVP